MRKVERLVWGMAVGAAVVLAPGCSKPPPRIVPAEGVIRMDGQPLKKAQVRFFPQFEDGSEYMAVGVTDEQGRFKLTCKGKPGACACENQVLVSEAELPSQFNSDRGHALLAGYFESLGGRPIPQRYNSAIDSPLKASVTADRKEYDFDLAR